MERIEFKAALSVDEAGQITGLASVYGTADLGGDVVHRGAFAGATPPLPMLDNHDQGQPVGVWESLTETAEGLQVKGRLLVGQVARADEVRALVQAGAMTGLSIGYVATKKAARRGGGRDLLQVTLLEVSVVAVPMHPDARIISAKAHGAGKVTMLDTELQATIDAAVAAAKVEIETKNIAMLDNISRTLSLLEAKMQRGAGSGGQDPAQPTEEQKAFATYIQRGRQASEVELKALSISSDPNGGYLAPPEFSSEVIKDQVEISPFRSLASVKGINAPSVIYPTRKPGGNATWDDDTTPEPETSVTNIFGQLEIVTKGMSTFIDIPNGMLGDAPAVESEVRGMLVEDFEKKETTSFTNGKGVYDPEGVLTNSEILTYSYGAAAFSATDPADPIIKMLYSIPPSYRNKGVWMMNGTTLGLIRTWKDSTGQKLWQPSLQVGQPETILGRPVVENVDMPDVAAAATPILYGDFSGYRIVDRLALSVLVDPFSQATAKRTRYHFGRRVGGRVLQAIKFKKLIMS